ncbi:energy-coupling factor ABC transporter ATP-binding protein [Shewanella ulleungensis]|jgi:tungstate transport system ATP-binding protein|uniref:energy-coupling factor ABC transporter ATP-binding protein n=1 Tax=Shewanella ulleungensis TaxID=2282699 RepID=UPI003D7B97DF
MTSSNSLSTSKPVQIHAQNLLMKFQKNTLFSVDELNFKQGDVIYLQGDNGSGKSTLMKILAGLIKPTEGVVFDQGFTPKSWWQADSLLGKAVYLHQHPYLFEGSVKYNLTYALNQLKLTSSERSNRIKQAINMAQLNDLLTHHASDLSGGERQRLAIARAWITQPKLLMLDEPISNMDKHSQRLVLAMINQLKQDGTGLLISSHQTCGLTALCQQHWHIKQRTIHTSMHVPTADTVHQTNSTELHYGTTD